MKDAFRYILKYLTTNWYEKLTFIFVAIIVANCISIFEDYWWDETFTIAYYTIFTALAIDLLLPLRSRYIKIFLQLLTAIIITIKLVRMDWIIAKPERWQEWIWWVQEYSSQLHPFIWISVALLLIYLLFSLWTVTSPRVFGFIGASIFLLTIADSFTPIWLWDEIGLIVFIGLLWLVTSQLSRLQREHPNSWKELIEYPLKLILPIALVLTILMTVGLNMPSVSPILQDPYTIWRESKGETVQIFLGDKGADINSPKSSGNVSSGYGRNDDSLGGGFDYDYSPVMTVSTNQRSYWRGESKAFYSGDGWLDVKDGEDDQIISDISKEAILPILDARPLAKTMEISQIVSMVRKDVYPVLFAAAPITKIHWIDNEEADLTRGNLVWLPGSWELHLPNSLKLREYPTSYSVTSTVPELDETALRSATAGWSDNSAVNRNKVYTQLPDTLPTRVKELAEQITAEATNDYDKAKQLEAYLRLSFTYNNKPDETKLTGKSIDFVDQFLFELKEGYCDYFSTSMAVMARSIGLPARWVKGFSSGALPANSLGPQGGYMEEEVNPSGAGTYTVRNSDAHSWVEIYFEGYGWIPFEATAGFSFPYTMAQDEAAPLTDLDNDDLEVTAPVQSDVNSNAKFWAYGSAALLAVLGSVWLIIRREKMITIWRRLRFASYTENDRIVIEMHKLLRICKKRGMEREDHETLREAILRWSQNHKRLREDLRAVLDGFEQAKYSKVVATNEEADRFVARVKVLIDQLR